MSAKIFACLIALEAVIVIGCGIGLLMLAYLLWTGKL